MEKFFTREELNELEKKYGDLFYKVIQKEIDMCEADSKERDREYQKRKEYREFVLQKVKDSVELNRQKYGHLLDKYIK